MAHFAKMTSDGTTVLQVHTVNDSDCLDEDNNEYSVLEIECPDRKYDKYLIEYARQEYQKYDNRCNVLLFQSYFCYFSYFATISTNIYFIQIF